MLINKLKKLSTEQFIRNLGWLGIGEVINRVFRLLTTVTLARVFTPYDYGMVSIIYTVFDIAGSFSLTTGIGSKIIQTKEEDLEATCNTSYWIFWILSISLFIIQGLAAYPIAQFYNNNQLILPICAVGLVYLTLPNYLVQISLLDRENRLQVRAWGYASQTILSNILLVVLALRGFGIWSVVLSIILSTPVWILVSRLNHSWRPPKVPSLDGWQEIIGFSTKVVGIELLYKLRSNIDYLIVGKFLGLEALGVYFFAFNAGLGISQSVLNSLVTAWYPHYCQVREDLQKLKERFNTSFRTICLTVVPLVALQTSLAHFYVPIIFGAKWEKAVPILILICLSAIPLAASLSTSQLLRSVDKVNIDLSWNVVFTFLFSLAILLAVHKGIFWVAGTVLATQFLLTPIFVLWVRRSIFVEAK